MNKVARTIQYMMQATGRKRFSVNELFKGQGDALKHAGAHGIFTPDYTYNMFTSHANKCAKRGTVKRKKDAKGRWAYYL